jgi:hypothetical protein
LFKTQEDCLKKYFNEIFLKSWKGKFQKSYKENFVDRRMEATWSVALPGCNRNPESIISHILNARARGGGRTAEGRPIKGGVIG